MIVGEFPSEQDERVGEPFQGHIGQELNRMLSEAGIMSSEAYRTNVCKVRPRDNQLSEFMAGTQKARGLHWRITSQ